jgi:hypothetical protein
MSDDEEGGIEAVCGNGHVQRISLQGYTRQYAEQLAGLMDGTSDLYHTKPRDNPIIGSPLGRCGICGSWIECSVYGFDSDKAG